MFSRLVDGVLRARAAQRSLQVAAFAAAICITSLPAFAQAPAGQDEQEVEQITVYLGGSKVVEAPWPMARLSISNEEVASLTQLTPTQVLLFGLQLGSTDLIMWSDDDDVRHARVNVLIDLGYVQTELDRLLPDADLEVEQSRDMVIVRGDLRRADDAARLTQLLEAFGVKYVNATSVAGVHQVLLQIKVAEVSRNAMRALGFNAFYAGDDAFLVNQIGADGPLTPINIGIPGGTLVPGVPDAEAFPFQFLDSVSANPAITLYGGFPGEDFQFFLQALTENQYVRILAEPSIVAMSGEEANFLAGGEFPIPIAQGGTNNAVTVQFQQFGVELAFRPTVLGDNRIRLFVAPEVSDISDVGAVEVQGFSIPSILTRRAETTLELHSGQSFAMAGLLNYRHSARNARVPILGDLPIIGPLFRSVRYSEGETELVIMVTASLVEPSSEVTIPLPGVLYDPPSDWELFVLGRLDARTPALSPVDAQWLQEMGLHRLHGPGAWAEYGDPAPPHQRMPVMTDSQDEDAAESGD